MICKLSVVIPNWNGVEYLRVCLPSIFLQTFKDFEIIVIDNGSTDGSVKYLKQNYPKVRIIKLDKNYGFAKAVNQGIAAAVGEFIILLNNDTKVDSQCFDFLIKAVQARKDVGMVAAKMLQFHSPDLIDSAGDYIDAVGHANNIGYGEKDGPKFNVGNYVFLVTGGGCLIKKEVFDKVGLFDEDYFAYFEDVDFCFRAQLLGIKGWFEPQAKIYHVQKGTSSKNKTFTEYLQFRNMTQTIIKDFPKELLFKDLNLLKIILVNLNTVRFLTTKGLLKEALRAEWFIVKNFLEIYKKRQQIQSLRQVDVEYIIKNVVPKKITLFGLLKGF